MSDKKTPEGADDGAPDTEAFRKDGTGPEASRTPDTRKPEDPQADSVSEGAEAAETAKTGIEPDGPAEVADPVMPPETAPEPSETVDSAHPARPEPDPSPPPPPAAPVSGASTPRPQPEDDAHDHDDPERGSFASKALQALVVLLVGAGVGLWAGPKLAPHLPESVAQHLRPAEVAVQADLDALRADLQSALAAVPAADPAEAAQAAVDAALAPLLEALDDLSARVAEAEPAALDGRLSQAETKLAGVAAQLDSLNEGLANLDAASDDIPPAAQERLAAIAALMEGVRAEVGSVSARTAALSDRLDAAETRFDRDLEQAAAQAEAAEAEAARAARTATLDAGFAVLGRALDEGAPLTDALEGLSDFGPAPEALTAAADGVPTLSELRVSLIPAARAALAAHRQAEAGEGAGNRLWASVRTRIEGVPVTDTGGDGVDAMLGRASERLNAGDLDGALAALDGLPPAAAAAMADWTAAATARHDAVSAAADWRAALAAQAS